MGHFSVTSSANVNSTGHFTNHYSCRRPLLIYQGFTKENATIYQGLGGGPPPPSGAGCNPQLLIAPRHELDCSCHEGATTNTDARWESKAQRAPLPATASEAARAPRLHLAMISQGKWKELQWFRQWYTNHSWRHDDASRKRKRNLHFCMR